VRVLLVGGQGYIGSSLARELVARGFVVSVAGRRSVDRPRDLDHEFVFWDASEEWKIAVPKFDVLIHLASANGAGRLESLSTYLNNLAVTRNVLDLCRRVPGASLLYVSTFQVLGRWSGHLNDETPAQPQSDYGFCHLVAEEHAKMFARNHQRRLLIVRPTNIIGIPANPETIRWDTVPADFCRQVATCGKIVIHSAGNQHRDFLSVEDLVFRISCLLDLRDSWDSKPKLVGNGKSHAIYGIAEMVADSGQRWDGVSVLVERGEECVELEEVSRELCLAHSSFQGATLVGPGKVSMETIVKTLMHQAMGKFRG